MKWHRLTSVGLLICSAPTSAQELPTQNLLPLALAQEAAFAGVSSCAANGFRERSRGRCGRRRARDHAG